MEIKKILKSILPHIIAVLLFVIISFVYFTRCLKANQ